jgi:hypothetical protein
MDENLKKHAEQIFVNPKVAQRVVDMVTTDKPIGWSPRSNGPYYKSIYANEIKPFIDNMILTKEDIIYKYDVWCNAETGISPQTVYHRVNQSIRYLCERSLPMEERQKYIAWYETVRVERVRNLGVRISFVIGFGGGDKAPKPEMVTPNLTKPLWIRKMDEWLEDGDNYEPFVKEGLALTDDEIVDLKVRISQLVNVQASITRDRVALIRLG